MVVVTARLLGSILTTAPSCESATHTPPSPTATPLGPFPTAMGVSSPVGSTRVTLSAWLSVIHNAPSPIAIPVGLAFGSSRRRTRPVVPSRRVSSPADGAAQT